MALIGNWISQLCGTVGTGNLTLGAVTDSTFVRFQDVIPAGLVTYSIIDGDNEEAGIGTFDGVNTIVRSNIRATKIGAIYSESGSPISLTGAAIVSCTLNAGTIEDIENSITELEFINLQDVDPATYTGQAGYVQGVNAAADGVDFYDAIRVTGTPPAASFYKNNIPAFSVQDDGIAFGGDNAEINTLTKFEEDVWSPTMLDYSFDDNIGQVYAIQSGTYQIIGNRLHFSCDIKMSSLGALVPSHYAVIGNLPRTSRSTGGRSGAAVGQGEFLNITAGAPVSASVPMSASFIRLSVFSTSAGTVPLAISQLTTNGRLVISGSYPI